MTDRARLVLADARAAIASHRTQIAGPAFRASWFGVVGLLRSVGHVLAKVDVARDPLLNGPVQSAWSELQRSRPEPKIFWGFIESERNRFLKTYEHGIVRVGVFRGGSSGQVLATDLANSNGKTVQLGTIENLPDHVPDRSIYSVLSDGPYAGQHETDVAIEATHWWEQYLSSIEQKRALLQ